MRFYCSIIMTNCLQICKVTMKKALYKIKKRFFSCFPLNLFYKYVSSTWSHKGQRRGVMRGNDVAYSESFSKMAFPFIKKAQSSGVTPAFVSDSYACVHHIIVKW